MLLPGVEKSRPVYCILFEGGGIAEGGEFSHARICSKEYFLQIIKEKNIRTSFCIKPRNVKVKK